MDSADQKKKSRRGKRGGASVQAKEKEEEQLGQEPLQVQAADLFTIDRKPATADPVDFPTTMEPTPTTTTAANDQSKKKRRGKRGGKDTKDKDATDVKQPQEVDEEAYAPIKNLPQEEEEEEEGGEQNQQETGPGGDDKWAKRMERKKMYSKENNNLDAYDHIAASNGTYRYSDKLLPHRDPSLPDQPELGRVDPDVQVYFMSVEKMLDDQEFETDEDRILFVQNVYREVGANDVKLAADSECSRVLEKLIRLSSDIQVRKLMRSFVGMFSELFRHRFASHVTQTLLSLVADIVEREQTHGPAKEEEEEEEPPAEDAIDLGPLPSMESLFIAMCEELNNQWTHLMSDPWGSHLVRAVLNVASGESLLPPKSTSLRSKKSQKYNAKTNNSTPAGPAVKTSDRKSAAGITKKRKIPETFKATVESITRSVLESLNEYEIRSFAGHAVANPVLQILVSIKPAGQQLITSIMNIDSDKGYQFMGSLITDTVGSHLVEKILANANPKDFHSLYIRHFKGNLVSLCNHHVANFVVQHLIQNTRNGTQLNVLMEEIIGKDGTGIEKLFFRNRQGVVVKILEACVKHNSCQEQVVNSFISAFHAVGAVQQKLLMQLVLCQQTFEDYSANPGKFDYHGSVMMEHLLLFQEPYAKYFIDSFMSIPSGETFKWLTTPLGSRIYEKVLRSPSTPLKAKKKLLHGLHTHYAILACDKFGSYVVDAAWSVADLEAKERIAEELSRAKSQLEASFTGKFILKNCRVESYRREGREAWVEKVAGVDRKREMFKEFEDILGDDDKVAAEGEKGDDKKLSNEEEKDAKLENSLWSTKRYDDTMASLGFKKETKEKKGGGDDMLLDDEPVVKVGIKRPRNTDDEEDVGVDSVLQALAASASTKPIKAGKKPKEKKAKK
ncbi:UNVERIFIED_CONTAM: Nucleolar protein 9 [Siphonaria sp. JEL0065]|nr:Nucleolar protein 9 [Siphonaria sp. JEL0065]